MTAIDLISTAHQLPAAWQSRILDHIGGAGIKVLRMDAASLDEETHDHAEALLVVEGVLELSVGKQHIAVSAGEMCVVPANQPHAVRMGSRGTLLIIAPA